MFLGKKWMKSLTFYTAIVMATVVACKSSPDRKIMDEFKKVDSSLQASKIVVLAGDSMRILRRQILALQQANPHLAIMADSVFIIANYAISYIDSIKNEMVKLDSAGETSVATSKIFGNDTTGKLLYRYLLQVRDYTKQAVITKSRQAQADNFFAFEAAMGDDKTFVRKTFNNNLDIASLTILSKFQNNCYEAAILALTDINETIIKAQ